MKCLIKAIIMTLIIKLFQVKNHLFSFKDYHLIVIIARFFIEDLYFRLIVG